MKFYVIYLEDSEDDKQRAEETFPAVRSAIVSSLNESYSIASADIDLELKVVPNVAMLKEVLFKPDNQLTGIGRRALVFLLDFMVLDLVDPDCCKLRRFPVNDPPQHRVTNAAVHPIPAGTKDRGHFAPGHPTSPRAQKPLVSGRHSLLAAGPFQVLGLHATGSTVDTPHRVQKEDLHAENGNELKATFRPSVIN